ncbi:uncharacterized protein DFL_001662 [Arthrobotrys flagrans]|uniref:DUF1740-domain-containing protein n=1 Tax=Arthrobotrys flagrans TaxID=97331 RepID=A0A437A8Y2_ARTFL|nr:hypothetical protein DFL_001662 [Arthrobotrys flagrans]
MASPPPETGAEVEQDKKVPQFKSFKASSSSKPVPQFSSFKPSSSSTKSEEPSRRDRKPRGHERDDKERSRRDRSSDRRHHHSHSHRHSDRDGHRIHRSRDREQGSRRGGDRDSRDKRRHHHRSRSPLKSSRDRKDDNKVTLHSTAVQDPDILPWDTPNLPYQVDTKGDPHNITYGTIHRYNIPKYWRYGRGGIVGLGRGVKIESDKGDGKGLVVGKAGGKGDGRARGWAYALEESRQLRVKVAGDEENKGFVEGWEFIELPGRGTKRKRADEEEWMVERDYRSIEGMQRGQVSSLEEDLEEIDSSDDEAAAFDADVKERTIKLSRLVEAEPQNIDAWFSLMEHQETIVYGNKEKRRRKVRQGEKRSLEEVKLGILEKAISKNEGNSRLQLAYMKIATSIWEPPKVKAKWDDLLSTNSAIDLWQGYLNFRQTDFVSFKYRECLKVYEECIGKLRGRILRYGTTEDEKVKLEDLLLYVIIRATTFMDQAGFSELSLGIWQGILEMNSSAPKIFASAPDSLTEHERLLDSFGTFWDSEVLRIGEPGGKGWAAYAEEDIGEFADPKDLPDDYSPSDDLKLSDKDFFGAWFDKEKVLLGKLPARTTDEIEEDDPFRVILFSDIRSFLWKFRSQDIKGKLGDAFLAFTGIVSPTSYQNDAFFRTDLAKASEASLTKWFWNDIGDAGTKLIAWVDGIPMEAERRLRVTRNPFLFRSSHLPLDSSTLFASSWWFSSTEISDRGRGRVGFCIAMLKDFALRISDERLALISFSLEYKRNPTNKKIAKQFLKKHSNSLKMWNAYATSEIAQGNKDAAIGVYQTALKMSAGFSGDQQRFAIELWRSWIWNEVDEGHEDAALDILFAIPDGHSAIGRRYERGASTLLKTRRFLEDLQHRMYSQRDLEVSLAYAELHSLFLYLSMTDRDPVVILKPLDELIGDFEESGKTDCVEEAYMSKARVFFRYALTARAYKASVFRIFLDGAIKKFPDNTAFLSLFVWNEARSKIEYRIRTMLATDTGSDEGTGSVVKWVFSIWAEMQMSAGNNVNVSGVRNLFERAVECERTKSSIQIWILYLQFEVRQSQPGRAKDVFFRAIRACPWSKDIVLSGFKLLQSILDFGEMRKVYGVMQEKELRVHVDIEELLEEWDQDAMIDGAGMASIIGSSTHRITLPDDEDSDMEGA